MIIAQTASDNEARYAAASLLESGIGALQSGDYPMARLLLSAAEQLSKEAGDSREATKARDLQNSIE